MSSEYYYLTASLPHLTFKTEPPFSKERFLDECEKWLSRGDLESLLAADNAEEARAGNSQVLAKWKEFDLSLKKELAEYRRERRGGTERKPGNLAGKVLSAANPLEMELSLERARWDYLDDLAVGHFFDIGKLIVYYLQLGILVRLAKFDKDKGETYYYEMGEVKYDNALR
ncbi:MAG: DUF2764 family protein [Candidatus Omnitrophota bacterium]